MNHLAQRGRLAGAAIALAAGCGSATAHLHQICYEGLLDNGNRTIVVGCRHDGGGFCRVQSVPSNASPYYPSGPDFVWPSMPAQMFSVFAASVASQPVQAKIDFIDANGALTTRSCTVSLGKDRQHGDAPSPGTYLEGFSTDASGLVMTGVWRAHFQLSGNDVTVPGDFIAVSGGVQTSPGAFVMRSRRSSLGTWSTRSFTDALQTPRDTRTYAVGLKIEGLPAVDQTVLVQGESVVVHQGLASLIERESAWSPGLSTGVPDAIPTATAVTTAFDRVALSGEFFPTAPHGQAATLRGQYASVSAPRLGLHVLRCLLIGQVCPPAFADGWRVESKDDLGSIPGTVSVAFWHLPAKLDIDGKVYELRGKVVRAGSALAEQPSAAVSGLLGDYAITASGGEVHWRAHNADPRLASNRLVQLWPAMDGVDARAASDHGSVPTPATLTAYALGIKLVPEGSPPEHDGRPFLRARDAVSPAWLCSVFGGLEGWRGCEEQEPLRLDKVCTAHPELREFDLCVRP